MLKRANEVYVRYIVLHGLFPRQTQETVDSSGDTEHQRREPEGINCIFKRSTMAVESILQCSRSDGRKECRHGRQVQKVGSTVLLHKPDGGDACTYGLALAEKRKWK